MGILANYLSNMASKRGKAIILFALANIFDTMKIMLTRGKYFVAKKLHEDKNFIVLTNVFPAM